MISMVSLFSLAVMSSACATVAAPSPAPVAAPIMLHAAPLGGEELVIGSAAPDFSTVSHDGADIRISSLRGKDVVLFFYSKDEAPGPTREAIAFRDAWAELERRGVVVIGISTDTLEAHKEFARHLRLPFHLVSDQTGTIAQAYGVANPYGILDRNTVLLGADGTVKKVYRSVDVTRHVSEVLSDLES
jgi:peroxiredoxin Q/BCP